MIDGYGAGAGVNGGDCAGSGPGPGLRAGVSCDWLQAARPSAMPATRINEYFMGKSPQVEGVCVYAAEAADSLQG